MKTPVVAKKNDHPCRLPVIFLRAEIARCENNSTIRRGAVPIDGVARRNFASPPPLDFFASTSLLRLLAKDQRNGTGSAGETSRADAPPAHRNMQRQLSTEDRRVRASESADPADRAREKKESEKALDGPP